MTGQERYEMEKRVRSNYWRLKDLREALVELDVDFDAPQALHAAVLHLERLLAGPLSPGSMKRGGQR